MRIIRLIRIISSSFLPRKAVFGLTFFLSGSAVLVFILFYYFIFTSVVRSGPGEKDVFYVDGSVAVSGGAPCAQTAPCKTIQEAVNLITAGDGDEVWIRGKDGGGSQIIYKETVLIDGIDISGTSANPTVFKPWIATEPPRLGGGDVSAPPVDTWVATNISDLDLPEGRTDHTAVWTGSHMVVWGGQLSDGSYTNTGGIWTPKGEMEPDGATTCEAAGGCWEATTIPSGFPLAFIPARAGHIAVWDGGHMIVWGGFDGADELSSGGIWTPKGKIMYFGVLCQDAGGCWETTSFGPEKRQLHAALWTGSRMLVSGGLCKDSDCVGYWPNGTTYSTNFPDDVSWTPGGKTMYSGALCGKPGGCWERLAMRPAGYWPQGHTAIWTGDDHHMVVWGGNALALQGTAGIIWTPKNEFEYSGSWCFEEGGCWEVMNFQDPDAPTGNPQQPLMFHTAVWTGSHMIVWGGADNEFGGGSTNAGGIWTPENKTMSSGAWCIDWGGCWEATSTPSIAGRMDHTAVWTGSHMIVWGGTNEGNTGGIWTPDGGVMMLSWSICDSSAGGFGGCWEAMSVTDAPSPRADHTAVFVPGGCGPAEMVVWGGNNGVGGTDTGGIYGVLVTGGEGSPFPVFNIINPLADVHDIRFENFFVDKADLVSVDGGLLFDIRDLNISSNTIDRACSSPIHFKAPDITGNTVIDNTIEGSPDAAIFFDASASISSNIIDSNTIQNGESDGVHFLAGANPITSNTIRGNIVAGNQGDAIELLSTASIFSNRIEGNLLAQNSSYGIWINGTGANVQQNKIFQNTLDANAIANIKMEGATSLQNKLKNNLLTNSATGLSSNIAVDNDYNFYYGNTQNVSGIAMGTNSLASAVSPYALSDPIDPADPYAYYLKSVPIISDADLVNTPLANGTCVDCPSALQAVAFNGTTGLTTGTRPFLANTIGARQGLTINQNGSTNCSDGLCVLSNSLQQAHDHASLSLGDHINVYTVYDSAGSPDRIYSEALSTSANAPITFIKRGLPSFPIVWHNLSYSLATSTWLKDMDNPLFLTRLDAQSLKPSNIEVLAQSSNNNKFRCADLKGFFFQGATSTPVTDTLKMTIPVPYHYHWDCAPYARTIIESPVYDTGYEKGVAYNTISWLGTPARDQDGVLQNRSVELKIATSNDPSGPWNYMGPLCLTQESDAYWFGGPGKQFQIGCYPDHTNHRYFRYQLLMFCEPLSTCPQDGDSAPRVDEVRVNYSP